MGVYLHPQLMNPSHTHTDPVCPVSTQIQQEAAQRLERERRLEQQREEAREAQARQEALDAGVEAKEKRRACSEGPPRLGEAAPPFPALANPGVRNRAPQLQQQGVGLRGRPAERGPPFGSEKHGDEELLGGEAQLPSRDRSHSADEPPAHLSAREKMVWRKKRQQEKEDEERLQVDRLSISCSFNLHTRTRTYTCVYTCTHTPTRTHARLHTYTNTHTHT